MRLTYAGPLPLTLHPGDVVIAAETDTPASGTAVVGTYDGSLTINASALGNPDVLTLTLRPAGTTLTQPPSAPPQVVPPKTTVSLPIRAMQLSTGFPVDDAVVTARIFNPDRSVAVDSITLALDATGAYEIPIDPSWSTDPATGNAIEGQFVAQVAAVRGSSRTMQRFPFTVTF